MTTNQLLLAATVSSVAAMLLIVGAITLMRWTARRAAIPRPRDTRSLLATIGPMDSDVGSIVYLMIVSHFGQSSVLDWNDLQRIVRDARLHVADRPDPQATPERDQAS